MDFFTRQQLASRRNRRRHKLGKPPRWMPPASVEIMYRRFLLAVIGKMKTDCQRIVIPQIPVFLTQAAALKHQDGLTMDSWSDDLGKLMDAFKQHVGDIVPESALKVMLLDIGQRASKWNDAQWQKTLHAVLGVSVYGKEEELGSRIESFVNENTILIKDIEEQVYQDVRLTVERGIRSGDSQRTIAKALLNDTSLEPGRFRKVQTRAKFIARDQLNKLNGDLTKTRQQSIGLDLYIWRGVGDNRERETHLEMNDSLCKWSDPDVYSQDGGNTWQDRPPEMRGLIPGEDYDCRCYAEPVFGPEFEYKGEEPAVVADLT